jgi:hypothetical protein
MVGIVGVGISGVEIIEITVWISIFRVGIFGGS